MSQYKDRKKISVERSLTTKTAMFVLNQIKVTLYNLYNLTLQPLGIGKLYTNESKDPKNIKNSQKNDKMIIKTKKIDKKYENLQKKNTK